MFNPKEYLLNCEVSDKHKKTKFKQRILPTSPQKSHHKCKQLCLQFNSKGISLNMSRNVRFIIPFQIYDCILIPASMKQIRKLEFQLLTDLGHFVKLVDGGR